MYHYAANNPVRYVDPTGMWHDNGDGTFTAEEGDTLWKKFGADWKEKSGFDRDPRTLQVGETVGIKVPKSSPTVNNTENNKNNPTPSEENNIVYLWDLGERSKDGSCRTLYTSAGMDMNIHKGQFNVFIDAGVASYSFSTKTASFLDKIQLSASGSIQGIGGEIWLGMKNGQVGFMAEGGLLMYNGNIKVSTPYGTWVVGGNFGIGTVSAGLSKGLHGTSQKLGAGLSAGYTIHHEAN